MSEELVAVTALINTSGLRPGEDGMMEVTKARKLSSLGHVLIGGPPVAPVDPQPEPEPEPEAEPDPQPEPEPDKGRSRVKLSPTADDDTPSEA